MFEDFFQVVFGTEVPAYQRFSQDTRNELDERARNISLISPEDSDEAGEAQQYILDKKALNNVKPFLFDMYKIVDAESWWEYVQNYYLPTVSIVKQGISPKTHWIWTYAGTSVLVEGQDAYIITPEEMQNQIYLDMVGSKIECYLSIVPIINFLARNQLFSKLLFRTN